MSWDEEMESHIAMRAEMNERAGMTPDEARRAAERAFGNRGLISEEVRAVTIPIWLEQLGQDLRYAAWSFMRTPGFTAAAVLALAIGIGTSTAVFSFVDRILFRPLPYANEHELVWFGMTAPIGGGTEFVLDQDYTEWRKRETPFTAITATSGVNDCNLTELDPVRLRCARVDANFLSVFGYRPSVGRDFTREDSQAGAPQTALISRALWRQRFGEGDVSGKALEVDGQKTTVAGVLPENFEMPSLAHVDILQVLQLEENRSRSGSSMLLTAFARMRPGVTVGQAQARMPPLFETALEFVPPSFRKEVSFVIHPLRDRQVRDSGQAALLLLGAVALVLLIAVANVANLLLARAASRSHELSVRAAIGAGKGRLARQALTESLCLGLLGGSTGVVFAVLLLKIFRQLAPAGIARLQDATVDWRVAAFALVTTIGASVTFGLAPALRSPRGETLSGSRVIGRRREWLRPALVSVQITLSLILLCGAALLMQTLHNMTKLPLGMETSSLFSAHAQLPNARYPQPAQRRAFWTSLRDRLASVPGVELIAIASSLPPHGRTQSRIFSTVYEEGTPRPTGQPTGGMVVVREVSPEYFRMLGIPVRQGHLFSEPDAKSIVLSEEMARRMFPGRNAVGRRVVLTGEGTREVTGVVADVRNGGLAKSDPEIYLLSNREQRRQYMLMRADARVMPFVREAFRELDPRLTVELETLDERVRSMRSRPFFQSTLLTGFAVAGLMLAAIGLYGVVSLLAAQRTGEIGVRIAMGATAANIQSMLLRQAGWWTLVGVACGAVGAAACARFIESLLYQVKPSTPMPLLAAAIALALTAVAAAWIPARRASRIAPVEALREF